MEHPLLGVWWETVGKRRGWVSFKATQDTVFTRASESCPVLAVIMAIVGQVRAASLLGFHGGEHPEESLIG